MANLRCALTVGVSSSALFDLSESDQVFRSRGRDEYERYQRQHLDDTLAPGPAFQFIRRLLSLNEIRDGLVEVVIMSRNSPESGLRVMRSIAKHGLPITRAIFREGMSTHEFMPAFDMSLFLSANKDDVLDATAAGLPAGQILPSAVDLAPRGRELRIAFDFDGVLADDASERVFQAEALARYSVHEEVHRDEPLRPGPLKDLLAGINKIQELERQEEAANESYSRRISVSLVTSRGAPAHERAVNSLREWGVSVDNAFFLGGMDKTQVLNTLNPHIYFDDQLKHLDANDLVTPAVHIPFGVHNQAWVRPAGGGPAATTAVGAHSITKVEPLTGRTKSSVHKLSFGT